MSVKDDLIYLRKKALEYRKTESAMFFPSYALGFLNSMLDVHYDIERISPDVPEDAAATQFSELNPQPQGI